MKVIIPARGGSKRIPRKNIKEMNGIPLIGYSIDISRKAGFEDIYVSTDDEKIAAVATQMGVGVHWRDRVGDKQTLHELWDMFPEPILCLLANPLTLPEDLVKASKIPYDVWSVIEPSYNVYEDAGQFYFIRGKNKVLYKVKEAVDINTPEDWDKANEILNNRRYRQLGSKVS